MARRSQQKAVVPFQELPPVVRLSDGTYGHFVRYRIVTEDVKKFSHWSPIYSVPIEQPEIVDGKVTVAGDVIQVTWDDEVNRPSYDVFVKFGSGSFEYHGTSSIHFYSFLKVGSPATVEVIVQIASQEKEVANFLKIFQTASPVSL
jgi:hypothetical protein